MAPQDLEPTATPSADAADPELWDVQEQFRHVASEIEKLTEDLSFEQLTWREGSGRWSIAECMSHLSVTASIYFPVLNKAIEQGWAQNLVGTGPFRHPWLMNLFIRMLEPPPRLKMPAPPQFHPAPGPSGGLTAFLEIQDRLIDAASRADGLDLARVRLVSPVSRAFRMSLGQCFRLLATHERRHLWQARAVREAEGFPES